MTNQQLKAHCEDVIANPQEHPDWVVDIARVALASLEAEPKLWSYWFDASLHYQESRFGRPKIKNGKEVQDVFYTSPPVPEMKPIELPEIIHVREPGFIGYVYDANEIEEALKRNGIEVKS